MAKIPFTVSARTAKLIGQENFANAEGAIIELVKNAYDADANTAIIIFDTSKNEHCIYIIDNGHGMTEQVIKEQWMRIGTDDKLQNFTSAGGRIKTGAKGIGRFALDRLGKRARMHTVSKKEKQSLYWTVNWEDFNKSGLAINDVKAKFFTFESFTLPTHLDKVFANNEKLTETIKQVKFETGTILKITSLNDNWSGKAIKSLFDNLEILVPPLEQPTFNIYLFSSNPTDNIGRVNSANYDDFDYKVAANYSANEKTLSVKITRNELDLKALENSYNEVFQYEQMQKFPYHLETFKAKEFTLNFDIDELKGFSSVDKDLLDKIGDFSFTFYFLKITVSDNKEEGDLKRYPYRRFISASRKAWLDKFGGVKIFRDGFRVRPYGEKGIDWLRLGERVAKSPQSAGQRLGDYRIRPNQIAGTVNISRIKNPYFDDKSGREGIQENDVFELFKNLLTEIINLFEKDRNIVMFHLKHLEDSRNETKKQRELALAEAKRILNEKRKREESKTQDLFEQLNSNQNESQKDTTVLFAEVTEQYEQELEEKQSEIQLLRNLASVGLIISSSAHELTNLELSIAPRTEILIDVLKKLILEESLADIDKHYNPFYIIQLMKDEDLKIKHWLNYALTFLRKNKRRRNEINFSEYAENFRNVWKTNLDLKNINFILDGNKDEICLIQVFEVDLDTVFNNLLTNSIEAFEGNQEKKVTLSWKVENDFIQIDFADNGRGLAKEFKKNPSEVFNAHETSKKDNKGNIIGTGLGLYIAKSIFDEYSDSNIFIVESEIGFRLRIIFPILKNK
jgi:signal transduction histidine kinase